MEYGIDPMEFWLDAVYVLTPMLFLSFFHVAYGINWYGFQSNQAKEIHDHMTPLENRKALKKSLNQGTVVGLICGTVCWLAMTAARRLFDLTLFEYLSIIAVFSLLAGLAYWKIKPITDRYQKEFLASTQWAREQTLKPNDIPLRNQ
jgi:hypothetical protein